MTPRRRRPAVWLLLIDGRVDAVFVARRDALAEAFRFMRSDPERAWCEDASSALRWWTATGRKFEVEIERRILRTPRRRRTA